MVVQGKGQWKGSDQKKKSQDQNKKSSSTPTQRSSQDYGDSNVHTINGSNSNNGSKPIPEYSGRPHNGISISEMFFPWHKLLSITTFILIINLLYFIAILIYAGIEYPPAFVSSNRMGGPSAIVLQRMLAKYTPLILKGHIYRLVTPIFMHSGVLHLALNSYFIARYGWLSEVRFNSWVMLGIYMYSGIGSTAASALITPNTISCGASGALFGLLAINLYFCIRHFKQLRNATCEIIMIVIIFVVNLLVGFLQPDSGADNWAHLFGFVYGFIIAIPCLHFWRTDINKKREKIIKICFAILAVVSWVLMIGLIWTRKVKPVV